MFRLKRLIFSKPLNESTYDLLSHLILFDVMDVSFLSKLSINIKDLTSCISHGESFIEELQAHRTLIPLSHTLIMNMIEIKEVDKQEYKILNKRDNMQNNSKLLATFVLILGYI